MQASDLIDVLIHRLAEPHQRYPLLDRLDGLEARWFAEKRQGGRPMRGRRRVRFRRNRRMGPVPARDA